MPVASIAFTTFGVKPRFENPGTDSVDGCYTKYNKMTWLWCSVKPGTECPVALMTIFSMPRTGCSCSCRNIARCFLANTFSRFVTSFSPRLTALTLRLKLRSLVWTVFILVLLFDTHRSIKCAPRLARVNTEQKTRYSVIRQRAL